MKLKAYVPDPLNDQASVLVDAQTDIKTAIKKGVLSGAHFLIVKKSIQEIIAQALTRIRSPTLKEDARISLMRFADSAYSQFMVAIGTIPLAVLPAVVVLMRGITEYETKGEYYVPKTQAERVAAQTLSYRSYEKGIPLQEFSKKYMERVNDALNGLAEQNALDPNDFTGRNSLRNLAEMQVRYERHQEEIAGFKAKGTRLVVCSVHADCSDRCAPYQGRFYSLDGSSGRTEDGREFVPLEEATNNSRDLYITKAGRAYQNGLLGFNCRHKLYEYKVGMVIPTVSKEEQKREYAITRKQREMERSVVSAREISLIFKDVSKKVHQKWTKIATKRYDAYKNFSKSHGRAYYPDRVKIL